MGNNVWQLVRSIQQSLVFSLVAIGLINCLPADACFAQSTYILGYQAQISRSPVLSQSDGRVDVVAGDLLWIGIHKIKLDGIVTLKPSHRCSLNGRDQRCARRMRDRLADFAQRDDFRCELILMHSGRPKFSRGGRYSAVCFAGDTEVNQELVARGWALAEADGSGRRYKAVEAEARANKSGIHQYNHEDPRAPRAVGFWTSLRRLIKRYPFIFAGGLSLACAALLILVVVLRWRARRQIVQLKYDLGKVQGLLEATAEPLPPRPQPMKRLKNNDIDLR